MKTYIVDKLLVAMPNPRAAAKYAWEEFGKAPQQVEENGKVWIVVGWCENTGMAIFEDDECNEDYEQDEEGIMWLTEKGLSK
jgi:hypothetical protein